MIVLSLELEAMFLPSGEKMAFVTEAECPFRFYIYLPVVLSQIFMVPSLWLETINLELGEKLTFVT